MDEATISGFRTEVRTFLQENLDPDVAERVRSGYYLAKEDLVAWHKCLFKRGWSGVSWPVEYGGPGWSPMQVHVFEEECAAAGTPILITIGLNQVATLLMNQGSPEQKERYLPRILDGSEMWCQGFSEPNSGSDLASLRCQATREDDHYLVNGTKIWTTAAHWSDWCLLLVRTNSEGPKHQGITILLLDMKSPGIELRPIVGVDGMHSLNQMFLNDVRIPISNRIGEENDGWGVMRTFLGNERVSAAGIGKCKAFFERLRLIAGDTTWREGNLLDSPRFRDRMAWLHIQIRALDGILRSIVDEPEAATSPEACALKLRGTQVQQELLAMISEAAGYYGLPFEPDRLRDPGFAEPVGPYFAPPSTPYYLFWRKATISGGSSEIMRNLIARALFS